MFFGIAGACQGQIRMLLQKCHHIAGMGEIPGVELLVSHIPGTVTPQGQHMAHIGGLQIRAYFEQLFLLGAHAGHMGNGIDAQAVLNVRSNLYGFAETAAAGAVGDADKIGIQPAQAVKHLEGGFEFAFLFGRINLEGNRALVFKYILYHWCTSLSFQNKLLDFKTRIS